MGSTSQGLAGISAEEIPAFLFPSATKVCSRQGHLQNNDYCALCFPERMLAIRRRRAGGSRARRLSIITTQEEHGVRTGLIGICCLALFAFPCAYDSDPGDMPAIHALGLAGLVVDGQSIRAQAAMHDTVGQDTVGNVRRLASVCQAQPVDQIDAEGDQSGQGEAAAACPVN